MHILIVDDELSVQKALRSVLETYDITVETASSALEGLAHLRLSKFDCILTDIKMPEIDGLVFQTLLRQQSIEVPVIFMTGHADVPMAVKAVKQGGFDFLEKPLDDEILAQKIKEACELNQKQAESEQQRADLKARFSALTTQERVVAQMVSEGYSTAAIASSLTISPRTVDHHRAKVLAKMQATSLPQLLRFLLELES